MRLRILLLLVVLIAFFPGVVVEACTAVVQGALSVLQDAVDSGVGGPSLEGPGDGRR